MMLPLWLLATTGFGATVGSMRSHLSVESAHGRSSVGILHVSVLRNYYGVLEYVGDLGVNQFSRMQGGLWPESHLTRAPTQPVDDGR